MTDGDEYYNDDEYDYDDDGAAGQIFGDSEFARLYEQLDGISGVGFSPLDYLDEGGMEALRGRRGGSSRSRATAGGSSSSSSKKRAKAAPADDNGNASREAGDDDNDAGAQILPSFVYEADVPGPSAARYKRAAANPSHAGHRNHKSGGGGDDDDDDDDDDGEMDIADYDYNDSTLLRPLEIDENDIGSADEEVDLFDDDDADDDDDDMRDDDDADNRRDASADQEPQRHGAAAITIENLVIRAITSRPIDRLEMVVAHCGRYGVSYKPKEMPAALMRMINPKCTALIYPTGIIVTTGAKELVEAREATEIVLSMLREICDGSGHRPFHDITCRRLTVHNVVGATNVGFAIDMQRFAAQNAFVSYNPDLFGGATVVMRHVDQQFDNTRIAALVFASGAVVITGARNMRRIKRVYEVLFEYLVQAMIVSHLPTTLAISDTRRRRALVEAERVRAAGPDSARVIMLDQARQSQLMIEVREQNRHTLALLPTQSRQVALESAAGEPAPIDERALHTDLHNTLAMFTHDEAAREQAARRQREAERRRIIAETGRDPSRPTQINVLSSSEMRHLYFE